MSRFYQLAHCGVSGLLDENVAANGRVPAKFLKLFAPSQQGSVACSLLPTEGSPGHLTMENCR